MKRILSILGLFLVLLSVSSVAKADITGFTVLPSPAIVGQTVMATVTADVATAPCTVSVNFDDGTAPSLLTFGAAGAGQMQMTTHIYTAASPAAANYLVTATPAACIGGSNWEASVEVNCPTLTVTTTSLPPATVGLPYSSQLFATGGILPLTWFVSGEGPALPTGMSLTPTGLLTGVPTEAATTNHIVAVQDSCSPVPTTDPQALTLTVNCPALNIATSALPAGIVGQPYSAQLLSSGGVAPVTWDLEDGAGFLPDGLTITPTGMITGIPTSYGQSVFAVNAEDSCSPVAQIEEKDLSINVGAPATVDLTITRMQLSFDNGRAETTVSRNQPGLRAVADLRFNGTGLLKGYWEVDGRFLAPVNQHLTYGKSIRLTSPAVPFLPTFVEGTHRVRLVITNPENDIPFPEAIYFVTAEESTADLAPLRALEPRDHAELPFAPQTFSWENPGTALIYLVEFFEYEGEEPVAAAYTKGMAYDLPETILTDSFAAGKAYRWWVKSYDEEGNLVGASELSHFVLQ